MKKTTFLKVILFAFIFLQSFITYSQNLVSYSSRSEKELAMDIFRMEKTISVAEKQVRNNEKSSALSFTASNINPVIKYAQLPYAGQVSICPNNGKELPKLFLCGGNDSRLIETGITDAQSIIWERFISGGSCATVSNSDCANESAALACWAQVATGKDYLANSAGQFRVKILDKTATPFVYYFNVYQNTLIPAAVAKSDIVKYGTGTCQIDGKITVGGFGSGYEYSFTTGTTSGTWQDSNVFTTGTAGIYTAFIRIKGIVGSCEFKVINLEIKSSVFKVTTSITSPKCNGDKGTIKVITNDVQQQYNYKIYNSANTLVNSFGPTTNPDYTFTGLNSGTYKIETSVVGSACMVDTQTNVVVGTAPAALISGASITTALTSCSTGQITITKSGGTGPYKYYVNIDGAGFVENPTNVIIVSKSGNYVVRVEDVNGCASSTTSVTVPVVDKPLYTVSKVDGNCTGSLGQIDINVINANGYTLGYSINNGANYYLSGTFSNLAPGNYNVKVQYKKMGVNSGNYCTDPVAVITIGASTALTASAGVAELSGCGPVGNELQGRVRITNPQGGNPYTAPNLYKYRFDNSGPWVTSNEAYINPGGPYTFYIQDASGCEYAMGGIILDPKPAAPTISVNTPVFNCDGSATSTVTVTNGGSPTPKFSYDFYMDDLVNTNTPSNIFKNVTQGDHTITVNYNVLSVSTYSNLLQEDFGKGGFTTTPGINPAYCFEDEATTHNLPGYTCNKDVWINDGEYAVASSIKTTFGAWVVAKDHTTPTDALGRFLCVNVGGTAGIGGILYSKPIKDVIINQPVIISLWAENLILKSKSGLADPKLTIQLVNNLNGVGGPETIVATTDTTNPWVVPKSEKWEYKELQLDPGASTNLSFVIRSYSNEFNGNDVLIDDIYVRQIPKSCNTVASFPIVVDGSKAFSAGITGYKDVQCSGDTNGEITLSAKNFDPAKGFQYSVNNGAFQTYVPVPAATTGSKTLINLPSGTYNIKIRYDNTAGSCTFLVALEIKNPTVLKVSAKVTTVATCTTGATITAEGLGGTPAYQFKLIDNNDSSKNRPYQTETQFINVPVGSYTIVARDLNLCQSAIAASVNVIAATPPIASFDPSSLCFDPSTGANIVVRVTGGVGPYTYTTKFNGGTVSGASPTFAGPTFTYNATSAGTYDFEVTDSYGCKSAVITKIISTKLTTVTPVTTALDCDVASANQAVITGTITGGTGPFVVTLTSGNATGTLVPPSAVSTPNERTFTYSIAVSGAYSFQIKDANNCITTSSATIDQLVAITLGSTNTNPKCNGSSDGTIQLNPGGGSGGFTYSTDGIAYNNTSFFTGLSAETGYTYYVKDSNKCTKSITVTLVNPSSVVASASIPATTCSNTRLITSSGAGGSGGYTYSFNGSTSYTAVNTLSVTLTNAVQTITYSVMDSNGCFDTKTINVPAYNPPTGINFSTPPAISCKTGFTTTSITLTPAVVSGTGVSPFSYTIVSGPGPATSNVTGASSGTFTGLASGSYTFEIKDGNGCTKQASTTINPAATIAVSGAKTDVKCVGNTDGTATFTVTGASSSGNFTYALSPNLGTITQTGDIVKITGLGANTYSLVVTDKTTGCSSTATSVIVKAATAITITGVTASNVNCSNSISDIVVTATGGILNYKYAYVTSGVPVAADYSAANITINTGATQTNLSWDVYVMDQNGCVAGPFNKSINKDSAPSVKSPAPAPFCFVAGSSTAINVSTFFNLGTGAHTYTVNGTALGVGVTNYTITASGTYTIIATDAKGCPATATYVIAPELTIAATRVKDLDCISGAQITFAASGGTSTYTTYEVQFNGAGAWSTVVSPYSTLIAGDYQFRVTDNAGCKAISNIITVTPKTTPTFNHNETQISCVVGSNGVINITNPTGLAPFTYSIKKGAVTVSTTATASGLDAGTYDVLLTDSKGCTAALAITLANPTALNATVNTTPLTCGPSNATVGSTVSVTLPTGGTGAGYQYSFNGAAFATTSTYTTTIAGSVMVAMKDSNNCPQALPTQTVAALNPPTLDPISGTTIYCAPVAKTTSTVTVVATTGTGVAPLTYVIVSGPMTNTTGDANGIYSGLTAGTYVFKVTDANGCAASQSYIVKPVANITANLLSQVDVKCNGASTGSAKISVSGFTGTYTATLTTGTGTVTPTGSTVDVTGLVKGSYTLHIVDDVTLCFKDVNFTITESTPLTLVLASNKNANCNVATSKVTVTAGGGKLSYSYAFISTATTPVAGDYTSSNIANLDPVTATTWYGWVKDANGCVIVTPLTITIAKDASPKVTASAIGQCLGVGTYTITATPGAGLVAPLNYSINGGSSYQSGTTFTVSTSGSYTIKIKDGNGCTADSNTITVAPKLTLSAVLDKNITCSLPADAQITLTPTGGSGTFTYSASPNTGTFVGNVFTTNTAGNYTFTVTDTTTSCTYTTTAAIVVTTPVNPEIDDTLIAGNIGLTQTQFINCNGEATAAINIAIDNTKGLAPFVFNVKQYSDAAHTLLVQDFGTQTSGLPAGFYVVTETDAKGCTDTEDITISQPNPIVINAKSDPITCGPGGISKGSVTIVGVTGGTGLYDYFITGKFYSNSALNQTGGTVVFNVVDPGLYHVLVKDANGCTAVVMPDLLVASDVKDLDITVTSPPPSCITGGSATVAVGALSTNITGPGPFFFQIYTGTPQVYPAGIWLPEDAVGSKKATFINLTPGVSYTFVIYDSLTGCYFTSPYGSAIPTNSTLTSNVSGFNNVACKGDANGTVSFDIKSIYPSTTDITYEIFDAITLTTTGITGIGTVPANGTLSFTNIGPLPVGTYYVLIKEAAGATNAGCSVATPSFSIAESLKLLSVTATVVKKANCNPNSGIISAVAKDGTALYTYQLLPAPVPPASIPTALSGGWLSTNTFYRNAGDYTVYAKDAYGCIKSFDITLNSDAAPTITAPVATICYDGNPFTITVTGTVDPAIIGGATYSIDGSTFQSSPTFTFNAAKVYNLVIKDGNGCTANVNYEVKPQLTLTPTITKELDCISAAPNATVTVVGGGGNTVFPATYSYTITAGTTTNLTGATSGIFTDLDAGNYTFEVTDGTCTATTTITIDALIAIVPTKTITNPLCVGDNGSVEINATGGTGIYQFKKGLAGVYSTTNIFSQTALEGLVTYYVKDTKGCEYSIGATIVDPTPLAIPTIAVTQMTCGGGNIPNDATITVTASGGTGTLEYSFDNGANYSSNNVYTTTIAATYDIIVKDANGCTTVKQSRTIDALDPPVITGFTPTQMTCPALTKDVTINHTNGIGTLAFTIVSGPTINTTGATTGIFTGLVAGDYMFRVTDANGCIDEKLYTVPALAAIQLQEKVIANVNCNGGNTGSATFTASDTFAPGAFTYTIATSPGVLPYTDSKSGDVVTLTSLVKGQYDVTIKDNTTLCSITKSVTITEPALALGINAVASNVNCNDGVSQLTMSPVGGTSLYTYSIVKSGSGVGTYSNVTTIDTATLGAGTPTGSGLGMTWSVDVYVKDANNCTAMTLAPITITKDDTPTVTAPAVATNQCTATNNYTFTATGTGVAPLSFSIDGSTFFTSAGTTYTFTVPVPTGASQAYTVTVKDGNGCTATSPTDTTIYKPLTLDVVQDKDITCAPLPTTTDAQFTLTAADGKAGYTYEVNINGAGFNVITSPYTNNTVGNYVFRVTDANTCSVTSGVFNVTAPVIPVIVSTPIMQPILCVGGSATMQVNADLTTGVQPYTYTVKQTVPIAGTAIVQVSNNIFTGLLAGTYDVTISDAKGCISAITTTVISDPPVLSATATPSANTTCSVATVITVVGAGGTPTATLPGYQYSFDNGVTYDTSDTYTVNDNGTTTTAGTPQTISYSVMDANGCTTVPQSIVVNPLNKPTSLAFTPTAITCKPGENVSTVDVKATNGVGALIFEIISTNTATSPALFGPFTTSDSTIAASFPGLLPGDYTFRVTDSNGCSYQELYTVKDVVKIDVDGQLITGVACKNDANGEVTFTVSGFSAGGFTQTITGVSGVGVITPVGADKFVLTNLLTGNYKIDVKDNTTNCVATFTVFVPEPVALGVNYVTVKNANCDRGAEIKATALDGTPEYSYAFVKAGDPKVYINSDSAILDPAFTWTVWAKDAHDCEVSKPITIVTDAMPTVTATVVSQCATPSGYTINVVATGVGTLEYSLDGNSFQTATSFFPVSSPGDYTVTVRDANKCTAISTVVTVFEPLGLRYDITQTPICNGNQGEVTLTASGGTIPVSYEYSSDGITYSSAPNANVFGGLVPGSYTFYVRDAGTTTCPKSVTVVIETPNMAIDFSLTKTDVICNGESNGTITVKLTDPTLTVNNNPVYMYAINPVAGTLVGNVFTNLPANTYTVTATSGKGCQVVYRAIIVGAPGVITVSAPIVSEHGCTSGNVNNYATISIGLPTGGSDTYTVYEFIKNGNPIPVQRGANPVYTETDLLGGSYVINVYDNKGCSGSTTAKIEAYTGIDFTSPSALTVTKPITCINNEEIKVNVTSTGGTPVSLDYTIVATATNVVPYLTQTNNSGLFTDLTVGSYSITVTNPATGCSIKTIHYVNEPNTFDILAKNVKNVVCYGSSTGSVDITFVDNQLVPNDDAGPFDYTITGPTGTSLVRKTTGAVINIPNLPAGSYTVKARLAATPTCDVETIFKIEQPTIKLAISETHTPISCDPGNDGTISVTADGGWPGSYEYELTGPVYVAYSTQTDFTNLTAGLYTLNVKDFGGCIETTTVDLKIPTPILVTASATVSTLLCNGDRSGVITVNPPTGGQGSNYSYILNYVSENPTFSSAPQTIPVFSGLGAGTYTVTVVDGLGCVSPSSADITIAEPSKVEASLGLATGVTCKIDAKLTLSATGGSGPYEYSTDKNFASPLVSFSSSVTFSVKLGDHQYYVRDSKGCVSIISNNVAINALTPLSLTLDLNNAVIYCKGDASAAIEATALGGLANYSYTLFDNANNIIRPTQATGYFDLLLAGNYIVRVDSDDCRYETAVISIVEPLNLLNIDSTTKTNVTCAGERNGKIVITASGGTGIIKYAISPNLNQFFESNVFDDLKPGTYDYIVQDEKGCFIYITGVEISEPNSIFVTTIPGSEMPEVCAGDADGAFSINITGGNAPYSVSIDNVNGTYTTGTSVQTQFDFTTLSGSKHVVYVRDANNCTTEHTVILGESVTLNPKATLNYDCVNNSAGNSVTVTVDASNLPADLDYALDGSTVFQASNVFTNLTAGQHTIDVRHTNGCIKQVVFNVLQVDPLTLTLADGGLNEIVATATGGGGNYQYTLNGESFGSQSNFIIYKSGDYTVIVTDANGCTASVTRNFTYIDVCIPNNFTPNADGINDNWAPGCTDNYKDLVYSIFDRYGRIVGTYHVGQYWDGKYKGAELPSGDYWYVLKLNDVKDNREFVGHFTLYR